MRVYLPSTLALLAAARAEGEASPQPPTTAHAVTPALREWYAEGDHEELEYAATTAAARESLRLLAADPRAPVRRVVLALEVDEADVRAIGDVGARRSEEASAVRLADGIPMRRLAAALVDGPDAAPDVADAIAALADADAGDPDAAFRVDSPEGHELLWYAAQEIDDLL